MSTAPRPDDWLIQRLTRAFYVEMPPHYGWAKTPEWVQWARCRRLAVTALAAMGDEEPDYLKGWRDAKAALEHSLRCEA